MKSILYIEDLTYTEEVLSRYESRFFHTVIVIILALASLTGIWMFLGKKESVVQARGIIRPIENISFVKSISSGKIKEMHFKHGAIVEKNTKLLSLDDTALLEEKKNILKKLKTINSKIKDASLCINSVENDANIVPQYKRIAHKRMQNYFEVKNNLTSVYDLSLKELNDVKMLPDFAITDYNIKILTVNVEKSKSELEKFNNSFLQALFTEKEELELQRNELNTQLFRIEESLKNLIIYSPIAGEIQELKSLNCGDNVFAGEDILKIVPQESKDIQAIIQIPTDRAGKVYEGMKVKMKIPAYPHYEFGSIEGEIKTILPDAQFSGNKSNEYVAIISLAKKYVKDKEGELHNLRIGLGVNAYIVTETDTIISYILKKMEVK